MIIPPLPENEEQRLMALRGLHVLDTQTEERFDRITRIAKKLFDVPIALVSLVDQHRQWFKSSNGLDATETPRETSFCGHAILQNDVMIVENAMNDIRFRDNPYVIGEPDIRFYLGYPLKVEKCYNVGTLCLIDKRQRQFGEDELVTIHDLGHMVEAELQAMHQSTTDELTTITNRRGFTLIGEHVISLCRRHNKNAFMLFFDLNQFKAINDNYGHSEGDKVLKFFARQLLENFRDSDVIARLGGDEFCVLISDIEPNNITNLTHRLREKLKEAEEDYNIDFSVGCVQYNHQMHGNIAHLLADADGRMYEDKRQRKIG